MYTITQQIRFCFGHRLQNYEGKCRNLHGHSAKIEVDIEAASLDGKGMVADVCTVEDILQDWVDQNLDHKLLLGEGDPLIPILKSQGEAHTIMHGNPTMENICRLIYDVAHQKGLHVVTVRLWESESSYATYRP